MTRFGNVLLCVCVRVPELQRAHLEGLLIDICVVSYVSFPGLAKEDEFLEEKNVAKALLLPECEQELVLTYELALLFQVDLRSEKINEFLIKEVFVSAAWVHPAEEHENM